MRLRRKCESEECAAETDELAPSHCSPEAEDNIVSGRTSAVRFGSKADSCSAATQVRFTPNSDRKSRHERMARMSSTLIPESGGSLILPVDFALSIHLPALQSPSHCKIFRKNSRNSCSENVLPCPFRYGSMKNIFPNYVAIVAPPEDDARAKWEQIAPQHLTTPPVLIGQLEEASSAAEINVAVNQAIEYRTDPDDRWQTPAETLTLMIGDCEDFAILKWALLVRTGRYMPGDFALVLGEIASLAGNQPHAFLVVSDHGLSVLDNKFDQLIAPQDYINWQPMKVITDGDVFLFSKTFIIADIARGTPS